jgi:hypothetical protein
MTRIRHLLAALLLLGAAGLLIPIYNLPVWWVSLTAPNYPKEAFPDGVRIHFHLNGVFNGCQKVASAEIAEDEALDCVHEMDTINHYVGMYPIAAGAVIETSFSIFVLSLIGVALVGSIPARPWFRLAIMLAGFAAIGVWMTRTWRGPDGLLHQSERYVFRLATAMDQDSSQEVEASPASSGGDIIARLKASLAESEARERGELAAAETAPARAAGGSRKEIDLSQLRAAFLQDQSRKPESEREAWNGSGKQVFAWHYARSLGRYFNNPSEINPMVKKMTATAERVFWSVFGLMAIFLAGASRTSGVLRGLPLAVAAVMPLLFLAIYAGWLWWYGHHLNDMGAFTLKPFMPTVFGEGKVAQFTTRSYPHVGFGLMVLSSALIATAGLLRPNRAPPPAGNPGT